MSQSETNLEHTLEEWQTISKSRRATKTKNNMNVRQSVSKRVSGSLKSQDIIDAVYHEEGPLDTILEELYRGEPLTDRGKRIKVLKILSVTLMPILGLWAFTVYSLSDSIEGKFDIEQTQYAVKFSVEIGMFLDRIQRERDMSVLYLSILGPETKTFLMNEYLLTDQALDHLSDWPVKNDISTKFQSKRQFKAFLNKHRQNLDPSNYDIYVEMDFYSSLIERFIEWMYGAIKESNMASIWKILVAYQKIVTVMEHIGIERALGTVFYVEGGFPTQSVYERFNNRVNIFKANYRSAVLYSDAVDPIYQSGVTKTGKNLTSVIEAFRFEIQNIMKTHASITRGQWFFDNMTLYLDTLLIIQQELAYLINGQLEEIIQTEEQNLTISACFLVIVFLMCPLVIFSVESLTSDIQKYAIALVHKTKELSRERKKVNQMLYQMVPKPVAEKLEKNKHLVLAEYFKSVTVMFCEVSGAQRMSQECTAKELVDLMNSLHVAMDEQLEKYEIYKFEAINDNYMIVSGVPTKIGNRHSAVMANLSLDLMAMMSQRFATGTTFKLELQIGISTGPCMAGVVGVMMPRYCVLGDTVNIAVRMKSYGQPSKIHISSNTYNALKKHGMYEMSSQGSIDLKEIGCIQTYWLDSKIEGEPDVATIDDNRETVMEGETNKSDLHLPISPKRKRLSGNSIKTGKCPSVVSDLFSRDTSNLNKLANEVFAHEKAGKSDGFDPPEGGSSTGGSDWSKAEGSKTEAYKSTGLETAPIHVIEGKTGDWTNGVESHDHNLCVDESEITYDSVGGVKKVEKEGDDNLLHACMSQGGYENEVTLDA